MFEGIKSELVVADEVREACTYVALCGVCFGLQSALKRPPASKVQGCASSNAPTLSRARQTHRAKICQFNVLTEQEHCV